MSRACSQDLSDLISDRIRQILVGINGLKEDSIEVEEHSDSAGFTVSVPVDSRTYRRFYVIIRDVVRPSHIDKLSPIFINAPRGCVPVVAASSLSATVIEDCRKRGWGHLDAGGNCLLSSYPFHLHIQGRPIPAALKEPGKRTSFDLTSDREAKILRALLQADHLRKTFTDRTVLDWCDSSPSLGYICSFLRYLASGGYIDKHPNQPGFRMKAPLGLLRDWATARADKPDYTIKSYDVDPSDLLTSIDGLDAALKKHIALAAYSARPASQEISGEATLYLRAYADAISQIESILNLEPSASPDQGNLELMVSQSETALQGKKKTKDGRQVTNLLQTYADLLSLPDGREAADELLETLILPHLRKAGFHD